jgi:H+/Cl- antiporter ClcA
MKWKDRIGIVIIMAISLGFCGLMQTGNPFTEQPKFRMTIEGLIIGTILGIIVVISNWKNSGKKNRRK